MEPDYYEFWVVMVKRSRGLYPDLHKTNSQIYHTAEDAEAARLLQPMPDSWCVVKMWARLADSELS